eukprot:SAG31_NODE_689_length_12806_cov_5.358857_19_plen_57_part_00
MTQTGGGGVYHSRLCECVLRCIEFLDKDAKKLLMAQPAPEKRSMHDGGHDGRAAPR